MGVPDLLAAPPSRSAMPHFLSTRTHRQRGPSGGVAFCPHAALPVLLKCRMATTIRGERESLLDGRQTFPYKIR